MKSAMAACGCVAVASVFMNLSNCTRWPNLPGTIQPTRYPGARHFENDEHTSTRPSRSNARQDFGRVDP